MIQIGLLEDQDVIEGFDFMRQLDLLYEGQSDHLPTKSTYGGSPINHMEWLEVHRACPAWIGMTVGEIRQWSLGMNKQHQRFPDYEFVRGNIPRSHILPETDLEKFDRVHRHFTMPCGKYKGKRAVWVKAIDPNYYEWAIDKNIIPYDTWRSISKFA